MDNYLKKIINSDIPFFSKIDMCFNYLIDNLNNINQDITFNELQKINFDKPVITVSKVCDKGNLILGFSNNYYHVDEEFMYDNYADLLADIINSHGQFTSIKEMSKPFLYSCNCIKIPKEIIPDKNTIYLNINYYN